jgi:hypothetical protein
VADWLSVLLLTLKVLEQAFSRGGLAFGVVAYIKGVRASPFAWWIGFRWLI